jgi:hypothetical protein
MYRSIAKWFIKLLGLVHLFNFLNLAEQVKRCLGQEGVLPVQNYVDRIWQSQTPWYEKIVECPSIFLWVPQDVFLIGGAWVGIVFSLLLIVGYRSRLFFILSFLLYMSYVEVGQMLFSFQWDSLILETTFLSILLPSSGFFFQNWTRGADKLTVWLFLWLLFRLYLESGVAKLFWGPESWSTLEAMKHYYETAPITTPLGYFAHFLPNWFHEFETGMTLITEILLAALVLSNMTARRIAFVVFTTFQLGILLTANYGIFNFNALCLHLFLLTDRDLARLSRKLPKVRALNRTDFTTPSPKRWMVPVAVGVILFSIIEFMMFTGGQGIRNTVLADIQRYTGATHISSRYHLFGPIDPTRYELVFQGTMDGEHWKTFNFPYKADKLTDPPRFAAPYHPRVDFRLWFERYPVNWRGNKTKPYPDASVSPQALQSYVGNLARQLLNKPELALRHFQNDPFNGNKPKEVRIVYYHFSMINYPGKPDQWWERNKVGTVYIDPSLGKNGRRGMVRGRSTK